MGRRPPAQVITDILFKGRYLTLITPLYLVIYLLKDPRNPQTWRSFRTTQEGIRASAGLDFKGTFSYSEAQIGELMSLKFLDRTKLLLSGTMGLPYTTLGATY